MNQQQVRTTYGDPSINKFRSPGLPTPAGERKLSPQAKIVLKLMRTDGHVTRLTAAHAGIPNLTSRVSEIRDANFTVACAHMLDLLGRRYGRWSVIE